VGQSPAAPAGGGIDSAWVPTLLAALDAGLDIVSGLHTRVGSVPEISAAAGQSCRRLVDIRVPPPDIRVATGIRRTGKRVIGRGRLDPRRDHEFSETRL